MFNIVNKTWKQLNSLSSIYKFSCLGDQEFTHQTAVRKVLGSIFGFDYDLLCLLVLLLCFYFLVNDQGRNILMIYVTVRG